MKYRDLITTFLLIIFFLSLAFTLSVNQAIWPIPIVFFVILIYFVYKLWIEK